MQEQRGEGRRWKSRGERQRRGRQMEKEGKEGRGGRPTTVADKSGSGKVNWSERFCWLYSNKQNHMCACGGPGLRVRGDAAKQGALRDRAEACRSQISCTSLYSGLSPVIGGDGLLSFNSKLAVLVSEPDVQIKKVRHAHLILVNLPLHISPACQLLCDSNHHRHMPLL